MPSMTSADRARRAVRRPPSGQLLYGAASIAGYLGHLTRSQVYHLIATGRLPAFKVGRVVCARTSTIDEWLADQERAADGNTP